MSHVPIVILPLMFGDVRTVPTNASSIPAVCEVKLATVPDVGGVEK